MYIWLSLLLHLFLLALPQNLCAQGAYKSYYRSLNCYEKQHQVSLIGGSIIAGGAIGAIIGHARDRRGSVGPRGKKGPRGLKGLRGIQGDIGPQGIKGAKGPQGPLGDSIIGPPGPMGLQGEMGPQGLTGSEGPRGTTGLPGLTFFPQDWGQELIFSIKVKIETILQDLTITLTTPEGHLLAAESSSGLPLSFQCPISHPSFGVYHLIFTYTNTNLKPIAATIDCSVFSSRDQLTTHLDSQQTILFVPGQHHFSYPFAYLQEPLL